MSEGEGGILITGTSRGIGLALVNTFLERGHSVFGCSRGSSQVAHARYRHYELDVTDEKAVVHMFHDVYRTGVPLFALLNNAGIGSMNHCLTTPMKTVDRIFGVNVNGTILCCREAGKQMMKHRKGRIINFGSVAVPYALEGEAVYTASKAAVEAYTRVIAREFAEFGVTVNAVAPNPVKTDLIAGVPQEKMDALVARQSIKRYGTYEDVLRVVDFFIDPDNDFVTGQVIYLGGP